MFLDSFARKKYVKAFLRKTLLHKSLLRKKLLRKNCLRKNVNVFFLRKAFVCLKLFLRIAFT